MRSIHRLSVLAWVATALLVSAGATSAAQSAGARQPVFLLCPHKETYSAWSLYLLVDKNDPSKVVAYGLEALKNQNAKDSSYDDVLRAQNEAKTPREALGEIQSGEIGRREITISENDALHLSLSPAGDGAYTLSVSMRVGWSDRFVIGGRDANKKDIAIKYNKELRQWQAFPRRLVDTDGVNHSDDHTAMPGVVFPVSSTGIYQVFGVLDNGETVLLMDR